MKSRVAALLVLLLVGSAAFASGAPWYRWINTTDRTILCSQIPPGVGWILYQGPYQESRCKKQGNPE
ncbi:hypothetical protein GALL_296240 [mine drainage metagenome]|uniref:Uncharacterized protein n=1 Tax=mine drainage metagenome TaxID=410659 RepID=A0A1J5QZ12_9ZZZZ